MTGVEVRFPNSQSSFYYYYYYIVLLALLQPQNIPHDAAYLTCLRFPFSLNHSTLKNIFSLNQSILLIYETTSQTHLLQKYFLWICNFNALVLTGNHTLSGKINDGDMFGPRSCGQWVEGIRNKGRWQLVTRDRNEGTSERILNLNGLIMPTDWRM